MGRGILFLRKDEVIFQWNFGVADMQFWNSYRNNEESMFLQELE